MHSDAPVTSNILNHLNSPLKSKKNIFFNDSFSGRASSGKKRASVNYGSQKKSKRKVRKSARKSSMKKSKKGFSSKKKIKKRNKSSKKKPLNKFLTAIDGEISTINSKIDNIMSILERQSEKKTKLKRKSPKKKLKNGSKLSKKIDFKEDMLGSGMNEQTSSSPRSTHFNRAQRFAVTQGSNPSADLEGHSDYELKINEILYRELKKTKDQIL